MLKEAMDLVGELQTLLSSSLAATGEERLRLSTLDPLALDAWAASREQRNHEALLLEQGILQRLADACAQGEDDGGGEPSLDRLREQFPIEAGLLDRELEKLRTLADSLRQEDQLTQSIVQSSRAFVQRYLSLLSPGSAAYNRQGQALDQSPASTLRVSL